MNIEAKADLISARTPSLFEIMQILLTIIVLLCFPQNSYCEQEYGRHEAVAKQQNDDAGLIRTLNKYGFISDFLADPYTADFLVFATETPGKKVLEIGAEFGRLAIEVLKNGAFTVVIDMDPRHIQIIEKKMPKSLRHMCELITASFPLETHFNDNTFDAIFLRVVPFLTGDLIDKGLGAIQRWLKPGGRIYVIAPTIYLDRTPAHILEGFNKKRVRGERWPGMDIASKDVFHISIAENMPSRIHLMDIDVLTNALFRAGFEVMRVGYFDRFRRQNTDNPKSKQGVGIVGVKPVNENFKKKNNPA